MDVKKKEQEEIFIICNMMLSTINMTVKEESRDQSPR